jgi:hypothetical protein
MPVGGDQIVEKKKRPGRAGPDRDAMRPKLQQSKLLQSKRDYWMYQDSTSWRLKFTSTLLELGSRTRWPLVLMSKA